MVSIEYSPSDNTIDCAMAEHTSTISHAKTEKRFILLAENQTGGRAARLKSSYYLCLLDLLAGEGVGGIGIMDDNLSVFKTLLSG